MAEFSALPIFTDSILADTDHLTDTEFGRYMRLLIKCWRSPNCRMPNDKAWIAKRLRLDLLQFDKEIAPLLEEFFQDDATGNAYADANACEWITQKRLKKEWLHVKDKVEKNKRAAKSRWNKEKKPCERISKRNAPSSTSTPTKIESKDSSYEVSEEDFIRDNYNIESVLSDDAVNEARKHAPKWDMQALYRMFDEAIQSGKLKELPKKPEAAFIAWVKKITKGKPPP